MAVQIKRLWLNLLLLLLVIGLVLMIAWLRQTATPTFTALLPQSRAEITLIRIDRAQPKMAILLQRQPSSKEWQVIEPSPAKADPIRVRQLLSLIDEQVVAEYVADDALLTRFGLRPNEAIRLQFNDQVLWLGQENAVSRLRYVLQADKIKLVAESVYGLISQGEKALTTAP